MTNTKHTQKRGPKAPTLVMIPLSELVAKLPPNANIKLSRVWHEEIQETLGFTKVVNDFLQTTSESPQQPENKILVEALDLSSGDE